MKNGLTFAYYFLLYLFIQPTIANTNGLATINLCIIQKEKECYRKKGILTQKPKNSKEEKVTAGLIQSSVFNSK